MARVQLRKHLEMWRAALRVQTDTHACAAPMGRAVEFLPAILEIQDTPPSPIGRAISLVIIAAFFSAILWATFSHIDIVAVAQGKIIPNGYTKVIQPLESGVVRAIHV
ncbi:MAG TPA: hypothetical protein VJ692_10390, partial [Nitrospiraceae bacterium]|nr:hypothetical protein [Nitrospiraceae bacterium]